MTRPRDDFPEYRGHMEYVCLGCQARLDIAELHYTCPQCRSVLLLEDSRASTLGQTSPEQWREIFDQRAATRRPELKGIFRFYELMAPVLEPEDLVWLGEGNTPIIPAAQALTQYVGQPLAYKNDGQNPSASFKDRGMACAFSYLRGLIRRHGWDHVLTVCASTGDTSAAAALYAAYVGGAIKSVVLLPQGKVTPQQLAQPLGSGAVVLELPGVFDDCMKVVEHLAEHYRVALLNSKNAWRILGQESYAFEVAQHYGWNLVDKAVFVPIGNAGNVTAIMSGFLKLFRLGIIGQLPRIFGVQSAHADPVFQYYNQADPDRRVYHPVPVRASVAQAAMIGNPVSFPRVRHLADQYEQAGGPGLFHVVQVEEQGVIEGMLVANRHGHIACTQGGECLAGMLRARETGLLRSGETAVLDATAHSLKFIGFQEMYFTDSFAPEYQITPRRELMNAPRRILSGGESADPSAQGYTLMAAQAVARELGLEDKA